MRTPTHRSIRLAIISLLLPALLMSCNEMPKTGDSTKLEMEQTESNQQRLAKSDPPPTDFKESQERKNLVKRLRRYNVADKLSYIYIYDHGKLVGSDVVKGKVSSLNSLLTTPQQVVRVSTASRDQVVTLPSPDFDGSYGENPHGIFYFTPDDTYVETNLGYMLRDRPFVMTQQPEYVVDETQRHAPPLPDAKAAPAHH